MKFEKIDDSLTEVTTPFLDLRNDYLQVFIEDDKVTDKGFLLEELELSGMKSFYLEKLLKTYGFKIENKEIRKTIIDKESDLVGLFTILMVVSNEIRYKEK